MATKRQKIFLAFFLIRATFFGIGFSRIIDISLQDTWISALLGMGIGAIFVFILAKFMDLKKGKSLSEFLSEYKGLGILFKGIIILLACFLIIEGLTMLINFKTSFFLLNTPNFFISIPAVLITLYIVSKGLSTYLKSNEVIFYITATISILVILVLFTYVDFDRFLPILTEPVKSIGFSAFVFATYSSVPLLFLTNLKNDGKGLVKMYLITSFVLVLSVVVILGIFGPTLADIYRYPEMIVLKKIKLFSFIEKIESIVSIIRLFDNYALVVLCAYTIKDLFKNKKTGSIVLTIIMAIIFFATSFVITDNYINILRNYYITFYVYLGGFVIGLALLFMAIKKRHKPYIQREM
ncbi:MAG: GerAB/ArcD/ProY family transporter [Bacilli bacterium]|nr:GerAB/ArcD/ProY family transporter [Bacilli bacterium]